MTKKVTFTLPERTIELLESAAGNKSQFVTEAIEEKICEINLRNNVKKGNVFDRIELHTKGLRKYSTEEIIGFIDKGRE